VVEGAKPPKLSAIRVSVGESQRRPRALVSAVFKEEAGVSSVGEDGTFSVRHVLGRARFKVDVPAGWMLKAILHEGRDITHLPLELRTGEKLDGVQVVITDAVTKILGGVTDAKNAPTANCTILVFPTDASKWYEGASSIRATRPDRDGRWQIAGLPAGAYLGIALDYIEEGAWNDPDFLESLRADATSMQLPDGGSIAVTLRALPSREQF
jgi:hypothetical protein